MSPENEPAPGKNGWSPDLFWRTLRQTLQETPNIHLTDSELIELCARTLDAAEERRLRAHVAQCAFCAQEVAHLEEIAAIWEDPIAARELEARRGGLPALNTGQASWWARLLPGVALAPLRPPIHALAAGEEETAILPFPVFDGQTQVIGLSGFVQRHGQEYYARVTVEPEAIASYRDHRVELVAVEPDTARILLQRTLDLNRYTLLGTQLDITTDTRMMARLVP